MRRIASCFLFCGLLLTGCTSSPPPAPRTGPIAGTDERLEPWAFPGADSARKLLTPHYIIYTTLTDDEIVEKLGQLMEGAFDEYQRVAPGLPLTDTPLECYIFDNRRQWAQFTQLRAGDDAKIYLRINRGGYTAGDSYVAYFVGDLGTYSVAAHEGWHQFLARHFKTRPPPFLEEGLACLFEHVEWKGGLPRWDLSSNPARLASLRHATATAALIPLADLCSMHAGQIVAKSPGRIEAFYAQSWAFARFCREAQGGKYRPALEKLLADCAAGSAYEPAAEPSDRPWHWDRTTARPLLERYLGEDFSAIDRDFQAYVAQLLASRPADEPPG